MNKLKNIANSVNQFVNRNFPRGSNGRFIFFSVLSIMLVSTLLWGSTYSLFVSSNIDNELNVYKTGNLDVTYTLSSDNVTFDSNKTYSEDEVTSIKPYRITVTNNGNVPYKFNVRLNDETASNSIDSKYIMTQVGKLSFKRLGNCTDNIIKSDIVVLAGTSVDIDVRVWLAEDTPNSEIGKSFFGSLTIDGIAVYDNSKSINNSNLIAIYEVNASEYIMSLYNGDEANTVHIAGDSSKPQVSLDSTSSIMLDNNGGYRYYGATPNNYVEYNDELWRIISVSTVYSDEDDDVGEQRVRIIRDESVGYHAWDGDDYSNDWTTSTLMETLNNPYYNATKGTCYKGDLWEYPSSSECNYENGEVKGLNDEAKKLISDALWYLGGNNTSDLYADDYYNIERNNAGYKSNPTRWIGKVGLMYPSDYAYAADLSKCKVTGINYAKDKENCLTDWLYNNDYQWLTTPLSTYSGYAWGVHDSVYYFASMDDTVERAWGVRPVVVLKSDVLVTGGSGTSGDAYKLASSSDNDSSTGGNYLSDYIQSLYDDDNANSYYISGSEIDDEGNPNQIVKLDSNSSIMKVNQGSTYGEEYRYYGASPNNYVDFNGELWRIISVSKVFSSESDTTGETRVRIIKDTKIGDLAWNTGGTNNWADATLMCQLNTMYYNDTVPACAGKSLTSLDTSLNAEAKSLIDNALWYLGGNDTSDLYADDYYSMERNNPGYGSNPTRWTGKVGIMYPSDYGYAADLSVCKVTGNNYNLDTTNCLNTDWLFNSQLQWLMSPYSGYSYGAWLVYESGYVNDCDDYGIGSGFGVRPLAVLKSDVTKLEGEGTSGNPYKLGLET